MFIHRLPLAGVSLVSSLLARFVIINGTHNASERDGITMRAIIMANNGQSIDAVIKMRMTIMIAQCTFAFLAPIENA